MAGNITILKGMKKHLKEGVQGMMVYSVNQPLFDSFKTAIQIHNKNYLCFYTHTLLSRSPNLLKKCMLRSLLTSLNGIW